MQPQYQPQQYPVQYGQQHHGGATAYLPPHLNYDNRDPQQRFPAIEQQPQPQMRAEAPAGWHADPYGRAARRYWDGRRWTEHTS